MSENSSSPLAGMERSITTIKVDMVLDFKARSFSYVPHLQHVSTSEPLFPTDELYELEVLMMCPIHWVPTKCQTQ